MNANHARPMLAFWLVAAIAASVTSLGLHEHGPRVIVSGGSASPVAPTGSSGLVLGGNLRPVPTLTGTVSAPSTPSTWPSASTIAYTAGQAAPVPRAAISNRAHAGHATAAPKAKTSTTSAATTRPTTAPRGGGSTAGATTRRGHDRALRHGHALAVRQVRVRKFSSKSLGTWLHGRGHGAGGHGKAGH